MTVKKIIPVELALIEFTDGEYKDSMILAAIASNLTELDHNSPNLVGGVKVIDWLTPDGKWRNTGGVSKWLAQGIQNLLKKEVANASETERDQVESI